MDSFSNKHELKLIVDLLTEIRNALIKENAPKKIKTESNSKYWDLYSDCYEKKYKVKPVRNAKNNSLIKQLVQRVPGEELEPLIAFYLQQNDSFYTRNYHAVGLLINDCEKLLTRLRSGIVITASKANEIERQSGNMNESQSYLNSKYRGGQR